jgi:hypothetical protein
MSNPIEDEIKTVKNADRLAETQWSNLFHKARTTGKRYSGVTVQARIEDGEVETHPTPVKTRQGEHLRGTDDYDTTVSLVQKSFMDTKTAKQEIIRQLRIWQQHRNQ